MERPRADLADGGIPAAIRPGPELSRQCRTRRRDGVDAADEPQNGGAGQFYQFARARPQTERPQDDQRHPLQVLTAGGGWGVCLLTRIGKWFITCARNRIYHENQLPDLCCRFVLWFVPSSSANRSRRH